jgi:predicted nucleotide-binding protein
MTPREKIQSRLSALNIFALRLTPPLPDGGVFIGHGRSLQWHRLKEFISDTLRLRCDDFNVESTAGLQTVDRIDRMLSSARMAFLVMTGDDAHTDGSLHARQNVIHEVGLFQARLGAHRAVILLENGCSKPSNLDGLTTINFPRDDIAARFHEVRGVLERERMLWP